MSAFEPHPSDCSSHRVSGEYCDGQTAVAHPVDAHFAGGEVRVLGSDIQRTARIADLRVSVPLGRLPRVLTFADGARLVLPPSQALAAQLQERSGFLLYWESRFSYAVVALAILLAATWFLYFRALPFLADAAVRHLGPVLVSTSAGAELDALDAYSAFKPSRLSQARQAELRKMLNTRLQRGPAPAQRIAFRDSPSLGANAFAVGNADIVLTDAIVELLSPDELVAVVAHELGHLHHQHNQRTWAREVGLLGVVKLLSGFYGISGPLADKVQALGESKYSRDFEREADAYALTLLKASNISPCNAVSALKKLEASDQPGKGDQTAESGVVADWFSSHPLTEERIRNVGLPCEQGRV